jgi:hypothetical protein
MTVPATPPKPRADQATFLAQARTLPSYVLAGPGTDDSEILTLGHQACRGMDRYPNNSYAAISWVYPGAAGSPAGITYDHELLMIYAATYLCPEHSGMWANF